MKTLVNVLIVAMLSAFGFCGVAPRPAPLDKYDIQGYDFSGNLIFKGAIELIVLERGEVNGQCRLQKVSTTFKGAVDKKDGPCRGSVSGEDIVLDLAPDLDDAGVVFKGRWNEHYIEGTWQVDSFAGDKTFGTFKATRIAG
jgi:hypothetical protein